MHQVPFQSATKTRQAVADWAFANLATATFKSASVDMATAKDYAHIYFGLLEVSVGNRKAPLIGYRVGTYMREGYLMIGAEDLTGNIFEELPKQVATAKPDVYKIPLTGDHLKRFLVSLPFNDAALLANLLISAPEIAEVATPKSVSVDRSVVRQMASLIHDHGLKALAAQ